MDIRRYGHGDEIHTFDTVLYGAPSGPLVLIAIHIIETVSTVEIICATVIIHTIIGFDAIVLADAIGATSIRLVSLLSP